MSWRLGARERRAHALAQRARHVARAQHEALHERSHAVAREAHVQHDRHVRLERAAGARRRGGARERFEARVERVNDMRERDAAVARGVEDERRLQHEAKRVRRCAKSSSVPKPMRETGSSTLHSSSSAAGRYSRRRWKSSGCAASSKAPTSTRAHSRSRMRPPSRERARIAGRTTWYSFGSSEHGSVTPRGSG